MPVFPAAVRPCAASIGWRPALLSALAFLTATLDLADIADSDYWALAQALGLVGVVASGIALLSGASKRQLRAVLRRSGLAGLLCVAIVASQIADVVVYGIAPAKSLFQGIGYALVIMVSVIVFPTVLDERAFLSLCRSLAAIGLVAGATGFLASATGASSLFGLTTVTGVKLPFLPLYSTAGVFRQRTAYGAQLFVSLVASSYLVSVRPRSLLGWACLLVSLPAILLSWARAVWLACLAAVCAWVSLAFSRALKVLLVAGSVAAVAIGGWTLANRPVFREALIVDRGMSGRELFWPIALSAMRQRPLFGYGIGQGWDVKLDLAAELMNRDRLSADRASGFHNFLLDAGVGMGLPVALLQLALVAVALSRLGRSSHPRPLKRAVLSGIVGMFLISFFTTYSIGGVRNPALMFALFLGIAYSSPFVSGSRHPASRPAPPAGRCEGSTEGRCASTGANFPGEADVR